MRANKRPPAQPPKRPPGRPALVPGVSRDSPTLPSVRVPRPTRARYDAEAKRTGKSLAAIAREVLIEHAPRS